MEDNKQQRILALIERNRTNPVLIALRRATAGGEPVVEAPAVVQFVVGASYSCTSACDSGCRWSFRVTRRTASSVWIADDDGKVTRRKVEVDRGAEIVFPLGKYSMAPIIRASERK